MLEATGRAHPRRWRPLGVAARGETIAEAQQRVYAAIDKIDWPGGFRRRDIGFRAVGRE